MPCRCVVSNCKGNYKNGPKVHIFFSEILSDIWICIITRKNFTTCL